MATASLGGCFDFDALVGPGDSGGGKDMGGPPLPPDMTPPPDLSMSPFTKIDIPNLRPANAIHGIPDVLSPRIWVACDGGEVASFSNGNWSITKIVTPKLNGVWAISTTNVWVTGDDGISANYNGNGWAESDATNGNDDATGIWGISGNDVWAATDYRSSGNSYSRWNGSWSGEQIQGSNNDLYGVYGTGTQGANLRVWLFGEDGFIKRWEYSNNSLQNDAISGAGHLRAITATSPLEAWLVGDGGKIYTYSNIGNLWTAVTPTGLSPIDNNLRAAWMDANDLWIVGDRGLILHKVGASWFRIVGKDVIDDNLTGVWVDNAVGKTNQVYLAGRRGIYKY